MTEAGHRVRAGRGRGMQDKVHHPLVGSTGRVTREGRPRSYGAGEVRFSRSSAVTRTRTRTGGGSSPQTFRRG